MARENMRAAVHEILITQWDPIGVGREPRAQDEYDSYIPGIERHIRNGADRQRLARHLRNLERDEMGLSVTNIERSLMVAARLLALIDDASSR